MSVYAFSRPELRFPADDMPETMPEIGLADLVVQAQTATDISERNQHITQLYPHIAQQALNTAYRFGIGYGSVEDYASAAIEKVLTTGIQAAGMHGTSNASVLGYVKQTTRNAVYDDFRHRRALTIVSDEALVEQAGPNDTAETALDNSWQVEELLDKADLTEQQRQIIRLRIVQEQTTAQAAEALNLHLEATKSLLFRAMKALRAGVKEAIETEGISDPDEAVLQFIHAPQPETASKKKQNHKAKP